MTLVRATRPALLLVAFVASGPDMAAAAVTWRTASTASDARAAASRQAATPDAAAHSDSTLAAAVRARIAATPGARVGVAFHDLARGDTLYLHADTSFHAASTMKVPVLVELFRAAERGELALDASVLLVNRFASIVDGSAYALSAGDDSDSLVYARVGERVPVRWLAERMIVRSSNLATNALIALVGGERVTATMRALGAGRMMVRRGVEDGPAYARGLNNTTTARDLATVMAAIETGRAASPASCRAMRDILLRQEWNDRIPTGLPLGTRVAHKTGEITATYHDAAIVYPAGRGPYVLVILAGGMGDSAAATALHGDIARLVHAHAMAGTSGGR
jgi:beta-lactamase class A